MALFMVLINFPPPTNLRQMC